MAREILATLSHNKLRTALTGLAVSWGIFLLIVLLSAAQGLVGGVTSMFDRHDTQSISISGGVAHKPYRGLTDDRPVTLRESDLPLLATRNERDINRINATVSSDGDTLSSGSNYVTGYDGAMPQGQRSMGVKMVKGRFINPADISQGRRVAVICSRNIDTLFGSPDADPIGRTLKLKGLTFTIVGVYDHEWSSNTIIPYTTARALAGGSDVVHRINAGVDRLTTLDQAQEAERAIRTTLGSVHSFAPDDDSALRVRNQFAMQMQQTTAMGALNVAVWVIGLLTMISGIVGVSNIMFVSVRERTHEIGVRRAIGARPAWILRQVILESVAITTLFGYLGIVAGVGASQILELAARGAEFLEKPSVDLAVALQVTAVLIAAGALAGVFPALKALKIKPVEALRDE